MVVANDLHRHLLVQSRLGGTAANVSVRHVVSFAPTSASDCTNEAFAANL
jgi:hypothetical protein